MIEYVFNECVRTRLGLMDTLTDLFGARPIAFEATARTPYRVDCSSILASAPDHDRRSRETATIGLTFAFP